VENAAISSKLTVDRDLHSSGMLRGVRLVAGPACEDAQANAVWLTRNRRPHPKQVSVFGRN
jgi:hypothetical protein